MADREKVINALEDYEPYAREFDSLSVYGWVVLDALALLKEQEAVEPILKREGRNKYYNYYVCPCCDEEVVYDQNYCSECGAKFMWEGR